MRRLRPRTGIVRQLGRSESGQSLVLAMLIMSALTITIGGVVSFTTGNEHQFGRDREIARAFHVAEAGVNNGLAVIAGQDPTNAAGTNTRIPSSGTYSFSLDGASGTYYMQKYPSSDPNCQQTDNTVANCWVVYGAATSPNGQIQKAIQETIYWKAQNQQINQIFNYGLVVDNQGGACVDTHGTTALTIKDVWISGDYCPSGNIALMPPSPHTGSIYIGGQYQGKNNSQIGSSSTPYLTADIVGGCTTQGSPEICSDSPNSNVWADGPPAVDPSSLTLPNIDPTGNYAKGNWSSPNCTGPGSFTFDSDSVMNGTTPTTTLMPAGASFDCTVSSGGTPVGHLKWDSVTKQLSISGTIWIDGNVDLSNSGTYVKDNVVPGSNGGTIFVNGVIGGASNIAICGPAGSGTPTGYGCPTTWDPSQATLGMVAVNPSNLTTGFSRTGNGELDMTILVNQGYADTGGTIVMGPILADTATIGGNGGSIVPSAPPSGFPNTIVTQAAWVVQPGTWKQTK